MPSPLDEGTAAPGAAAARPEPNGVKGYLLLFGLIAMIGWPLATYGVLARMHGYASDGPLISYLTLFFFAANGLFSFVTGYKILAGNLRAREYTSWLLVFILIESTLFRVVFGAGSEIPFYLLPAAILMYFSKSELCRNNYGAQYRHIPLPSQLTPLLKRVCLAWGALAAVLIAYQLVVCLVTPGALELNGFVRIARGVGSFPASAGGTNISIPVPAGVTHVNLQPKEDDGIRYTLRFMGENRRGNFFVHCLVGALTGLEDQTLDSARFDNYKKAAREILDKKATQAFGFVEEQRYILTREDETLKIGEELFTRRTATAHTLLMGKLLVLEVSFVGQSKAKTPDPAATARAWMEQVLKSIPAEAPPSNQDAPRILTSKEMPGKVMDDEEQNDPVTSFTTIHPEKTTGKASMPPRRS